MNKVLSFGLECHKQDIKAIFIFRRNVEVTQAGESATKHNIKNIKLIKDGFQAFSLKYF